jgi:hypothetical protein
MNPETNPFAALTLIAAPAVLTNACSVLALGTSNRLARAVDLTRSLSSQLEKPGELTEAQANACCDELTTSQSRALMLLRALQSFYIGIGSFSAAAFLSLVGAALHPVGPQFVAYGMEVVAVLVGAIAVVAVVRGTTLLVTETRVAVGMMKKRTERVQQQFLLRQKNMPSDKLI